MKPALLRSSNFRLALVYMGLFGGSVLILLGFIYWSTAGTLLGQVDATIETEIDGLADGYRNDGLAGLSAVITRRVSARSGRSGIYLLTNLARVPVVGNLDRWPPGVEADTEGWMEFRLDASIDTGMEGAVFHRARARQFRLPGGFYLLVGRDIHDLELAQRRIVNALVWGLVITLVLALLGAVMMSRSTARRIDAITGTSRQIMAGDLSRRIPRDGSDDDFDRLAEGLNAMLERIETLMEELRRVSDNIAHDLKTPLTRLKGHLEQLRIAQVPDADFEQRLGQALQEADGLLATFDALMRISRIESGARREAFDEVDLVALAGDAAELYRAVAEQHGQSLALSVREPARVWGDRDLLFQALVNLLDNAIKFGPVGGRVELVVEPGRDADHGASASASVCVSVADVGPGVPAGERERVLQRFFRLEQSRTSPGNGLGLSLVAAVSRLHQARLELRDNHPGLRVSLCLPRSVAPGAPR